MSAGLDQRAAETVPPARKRADRLLWFGVGGVVVTAICCFTPLLAVTLGAAGFAAALAWLDLILLPTLAVFVGPTAYALCRCRRRA